MKVNELRIGNWVETPYNESIQIIMVNKGYVMDYFNEMISLDEINAIPLTEEWLDRFGAEKVNEISEYFDGEDMYSYELYLDGAECLFDRKCNCQPYEHIKYVHQLQNLYFALTGEELKQNVTENV